MDALGPSRPRRPPSWNRLRLFRRHHRRACQRQTAGGGRADRQRFCDTPYPGFAQFAVGLSDRDRQRRGAVSNECSRSGRVPRSSRSRQFYEIGAAVQRFERFLKLRRKKRPQGRVRRVAASQPDHFWGTPVSTHQRDKVRMFGHDDIRALPSREKDFLIFGIAESNISDGKRCEGKCLRQPSRHGGRQVRIKPDCHAAATAGGSVGPLAKTRHALTSSGSKSRSSSRTSAAVNPEANKSRTSLTRIRIPRTHGRPPHWRGLTVIRFSKSSCIHVKYGCKASTRQTSHESRQSLTVLASVSG